MGNTYTRQSSYSDGDVITAAHTNDAFNQLLAAFQASSGHTHDGTANEGGPITKMLGTSLTLGDGTAGTDITVTFDGETSDGVLKWMEDEDYFEFSDDILVASTEKLQFRDTALYINSSTDGQLDIVADTEVQIAATTVDINGNVDISGTLTVGGALDFSEANISNVGTLGLDSIFGDADTDTSIAFSGSDVITVTTGGQAQVTFTNGAIVPSTDNDIDLGTSSVEFKDAFFDGTVTTDALVADTADINGGSVDGVTLGTNSAITQAVIDDIDINGKVITMTGSTSDTAVFTAGTNGTLNITTTDDAGANANIQITADGTAELAGTTVTLDSSGGITLDADGGTITFSDGGSSLGTITSSGYSGTAAVATTVTITDNESTDEDNAIIFAAGADLDGGNLGLESDGDLTYNPSTGRLTATQLAGTLQTAAQANVTSLGTLTTLTVDNVIINGSTIGHTGDTDLMTVASGVLTVAGEVDTESLDVSGDIDVDGTTNLDNTDIDGTLVVDGSNISLDSTSTLNIDNSNTSNGITIGTATSGVPISIGHTTSEVTVNDNLTVTGDLTVSGTTTTVNSTTVNLNDHNIVLDSGNSTSAVINGAGITIEGGSGDDATFSYNTTGPKFELKLGSSHEDLQEDQLIAASLDISGDIDVDGTANLDVVDITDTTDSSDATGDTGALRTEGGASIAKKLFVGTDLDVDGTANLDNTDIDGTLAVDGATISLDATTSLNIDNSNTSNGITIGTATSGVPVSIGHTTSEVTVNDNMTVTGTMTQTGVSTSTAKDVFNAGMSVKNGSTSAGFVEFFEDSDNESTNEDNAIVFTSGGDVDGGNIGLESDGDLTYNPSTGRLTATQLSGTLQTAAQTNITSLGTLTTLTVDNVIINGSTIGHTGDTDLMTVASGVLTVAGEVDATSLDISGDADIDGTLEADAITVNGTALNTVIGNEATALAIALG